MNAFPLVAPAFGKARRRRGKTVAEIQRTVAAYYGISPDHMVSQARHWDVSHPRQVAMCLAREIIGMSFPGLGRRFGHRDHTTVIHAIRSVEARAAKDAELAYDLETLREALT